ncbi:MAG: hypothetical protein EOO38_04590 [Cytophagaceae bacterium]|nr:MAG: hypothetical protein EOO38_04590 [Cytophagaceae bacterium]
MKLLSKSLRAPYPNFGSHFLIDKSRRQAATKAAEYGREGEILDRIARLTPNQFENLTYECIKAAGLKNVVWRTPGADGGRDIEGISFARDISGQDVVQKWYIECKLYSTSLDWPTVWNKIAHADAQNADFLFIVSNSNPSPMCETRIEEWNAARKRPIVRFWRGYDLPSFLAVHQRIAVMYGLSEGDQRIDASVLPLTIAIAKTAQAAFLSDSFGNSPTVALEAAAALSELLSKRLDRLKKYGIFSPDADAGETLDFDWLRQTGSSAAWEGVGLRAILAFARHIAGAGSAQLDVGEEIATLILEEARFKISGTGAVDLDMIAGWCGLTLQYETETLEITIMRRV